MEEAEEVILPIAESPRGVTRVVCSGLPLALETSVGASGNVLKVQMWTALIARLVPSAATGLCRLAVWPQRLEERLHVVALVRLLVPMKHSPPHGRPLEELEPVLDRTSGRRPDSVASARSGHAQPACRRCPGPGDRDPAYPSFFIGSPQQVPGVADMCPHLAHRY